MNTASALSIASTAPSKVVLLVPFRILPSVFRYGSALFGVALATGIRILLTPWLGQRSAFLLLLPAILFSSWFGGLGPGLLAIGVGAVLSTWLFLLPQGSLFVLDPGEVLAFLLYILAGLVVTLLSTAQRQAQDRATANALVADAQRQEIAALNHRLSQAVVESNHRIKNNLQVVSSLLALRSTNKDGSVEASEIERIQRHVDTLAVLHDLLTWEAKTSPGTHTISLRAILGKLVPMLQATVGGRPIVYCAEDADLPSKKGVSLSLLLNELTSNALKHGTGKIKISVTVSGETACLSVCDDGPGFPVGFDPRQAAHTGLELVQTIAAHDLGGQVVYANRAEGGGRVAVTFPLGNASGRE
jgi:two-component sensor histidine kinase